jgi:hypothetical protein
VIPVRVSPDVVAHVAARGMMISDLHPLYGRLCPVCDEQYGNGPIALVYVGRGPDRERGGWEAAAVAVHERCTDRPATAVQRHDAECGDRSCSDTVIGSTYGRGPDRFYVTHAHTWATAAGLSGSERHAHHVDQGHPGNWTNRDHEGVQAVPWDDLPWVKAARDHREETA